MLDIIMNLLSIVFNFVIYTALPSAIILAVGILLITLVLNLLGKLLEKSKLDPTAHGLIKNVTRVVLYGLLALIVASRMGVDVTGIVALASVLTLAVSLSVQNLLTNLISGFVLLYTKPFGSGDYVEVAGQSGSVLEIGLTYTKLATPDNKEVSIPNGSVTAAEIVNYTTRGVRRVDITVSASYDAPMKKVLECLHEAAAIPTVMADPAVFAAVDSYGDNAINYVLRVWSTTDDYWTTYFEITHRIKDIFDAKGVEMTYPHVNVHVVK